MTLEINTTRNSTLILLPYLLICLELHLHMRVCLDLSTLYPAAGNLCPTVLLPTHWYSFKSVCLRLSAPSFLHVKSHHRSQPPSIYNLLPLKHRCSNHNRVTQKTTRHHCDYEYNLFRRALELPPFTLSAVVSF